MKITTAVAATTIVAAASLVAAHGPSNKEEVKAFHDRQASMYHCAPQVAAYNAVRRQNWAQKVLGGAPLAAKQYFVGQGSSSGSSSGDAIAQAEAEGKQIMACDPVGDTMIKNSTCVLAPETTEGPYYHTEGHLIRSNIAESQLGLLFLMNIGVMDVETCEPVPNVLVDIWMANATGYYAGHPDTIPGLENETPKASGLRKGLLSAYPRTKHEETWLRGALPTDANGVTEFTSIFPGSYTGRATHVHVKVHPEWTTYPNGTFSSGRLIHTGQFFFDDEINMQIDKMPGYNENWIFPKWGRTRNWDDSLNIYQDSYANGYMPMFDLEYLGGVLSQGLIGYVTMGVNMSADFEGVWTPESGKGGVVKQVPKEKVEEAKAQAAAKQAKSEL